MHANSFYRHTATPYYRSRHHEALHRPATNYFQFFTMFPIIAQVNTQLNRCYRHTTSPYCQHRQATNYFQRNKTFPYYRSGEHAHKPILSSHELFSFRNIVESTSASHNVSIIVPIIAHVITWSTSGNRLIIASTGNQLFSASHNVSLLSLMWTCTQIAFLVTQPLPIIAHVNMKHCKR